jgi:hypothetical protein
MFHYISRGNTTHLPKFIPLVQHLESRSPTDVAMQGNLHRFRESTTELRTLKVFNSLARRLNLHEIGASKTDERRIEILTLIARVRRAVMTSSDPPSTRLSGMVGSYSQMAVAFSTTAVLVIRPITSTFPRLTTCARQLKEDF